MGKAHDVKGKIKMAKVSNKVVAGDYKGKLVGGGQLQRGFHIADDDEIPLPE